MASFKMACIWKGEESIKKIHFFRVYIEISQSGRDVIKMALSENQSEIAEVKCLLLRFSVGKSNSETIVLLTSCTLPTL